ncbi:universal stress protein [Oculatella sp. LEGE 06141]|nr:universal stress protein [Oculatella sp. LEGE 06141]
MLARLQTALGQQDLVEQILLASKPLFPMASKATVRAGDRSTVNLVVGYTGTFNSQTSLDLALWIAHQTRLATQAPVTVHVVYVAEPSAEPNRAAGRRVKQGDRALGRTQRSRELASPASTSSAVLTRPQANRLTETQLEEVDQILWKARCLADEWRGSLSTHLRFGPVAEELNAVAVSEAADLLFLGCRAAEHPIVQQLAARFPCPILGIPNSQTFLN